MDESKLVQDQVQLARVMTVQARMMSEASEPKLKANF